MARFLCVCAGGAAGTAMRYLLVGWLTRVAGLAFPWGTLSVNLVGSFLLGLVMEVGLTTSLLPSMLRATLAIGVLGGFTTYSSFNYETLRMVQGGSPALALANVAATLFGCWTAGVLGLWSGRLLVRA